MEKCTFYDIGSKKANAYIIYENKRVIAFLDIHPAAVGHTLVIPKNHYEKLSDIPSTTAQSLMTAIHTVVRHYRTKGIQNFNVLHASGRDAQQSVPHCHFHIVPRKRNDGLNLWYRSVKQKPQNFKRTEKKLRFR
ncbi:MAG: HIT domain-containing protein [Candidatus Aenigmarchaeota archaeon]|nr:HIT domain-containing protein [Candidatus Aenigmarchaeota archaeon]